MRLKKQQKRKKKSVAGIEQATYDNLKNCHTNCTTHRHVKFWELFFQKKNNLGIVFYLIIIMCLEFKANNK